MLSNVLIYDVKSQSLAKINVPSTFPFQCFTKPALVDVGKVVALVVDNQMQLKLVKIERSG